MSVLSLSARRARQHEVTCSKPSKLNKKPQNFRLSAPHVLFWDLATSHCKSYLLHDPLRKSHSRSDSTERPCLLVQNVSCNPCLRTIATNAKQRTNEDMSRTGLIAKMAVVQQPSFSLILSDGKKMQKPTEHKTE